MNFTEHSRKDERSPKEIRSIKFYIFFAYLVIFIFISEDFKYIHVRDVIIKKA